MRRTLHPGLEEAMIPFSFCFKKSDEIEVKEEISRKPEDIAALSQNKRSLGHVLIVKN